MAVPKKAWLVLLSAALACIGVVAMFGAPNRDLSLLERYGRTVARRPDGMSVSVYTLDVEPSMDRGRLNDLVDKLRANGWRCYKGGYTPSTAENWYCDKGEGDSVVISQAPGGRQSIEYRCVVSLLENETRTTVSFFSRLFEGKWTGAR